MLCSGRNSWFRFWWHKCWRKPQPQPSLLTPANVQSPSDNPALVRPLESTSNPAIHVTNPRLRRILMFPNFPETPEDASSLLDITRSHREERRCLKLAAEQAVRQSRIELNLITRQTTDENESHRTVDRLQTLLGDLEKTQAELSNADNDVGGVRSLIRRKGFSIDVGPGDWAPLERQLSGTSSDDPHPVLEHGSPSPAGSKSSSI